MKNLTPHAVVILPTSGEVITTLPPSGQIARVSVTREQSGTIGAVPIYRSVFGSPVGVPDPEYCPDCGATGQADGLPCRRCEATGYLSPALIVSALVRLALPGRRDLFSPGELVRDSAGQPVGCRGLEGNL